MKFNSPRLVQVASFWQGSLAQGSRTTSHVGPVNPGAQTHTKLVPLVLQLAPFAHGWKLHGSKIYKYTE